MINTSGPDVTAFRTTACTATHMKLAQANATVECIFLTGHFVRLKLKRPAIDRKRPENVRCPDVILFPALCLRRRATWASRAV